MEKIKKRPYPHNDLARAIMLAGLGVLAATGLLAGLGREPFGTWFYVTAWWSYILIADGWVYRHRGESLLISYPGRFVFLAGWSVFLWSLFELVNFRLGNWAYVGLPDQTVVRWAGYALSFATVTPAILETADLLDGAFRRMFAVRPFFRSGRALFWVAGAACLVLPIVGPRFFYPLIWGAPFFLLDPLNDRWGVPSLLSDWRSGQMRRWVLLLGAGLACGLLWESFNSLASARWVYSIPGMEEWKLFEMPLLGYLGFLPFALSVYASSVTAVRLWEKMNKPVRLLCAGAALGAAVAVFAGIDWFTVRMP
ncbi:MAG: hypothetical protein KBG07_04855 [Elusimicrobia bacterium]|nr:hypothetical protein [Elusimicrobiota bacterium]